MREIRTFLVLLCLALPAQAAVHVWTGAASDRFSDAGNWRGGSPAGDAAAELSFPAGVARLAATNDLQGLTVRDISFSGAGYVISGNAITLAADATVSDRLGGPNELACDLVLTGGVTVTVQRNDLTSPDGLTFSGAVSGSGPLTKLGPVRLTFSGAQPNRYTGATRVLAGGLRLMKSSGVTAVPADLVIGSTGANGDFGSVATFTSEQIADAASVRIGGSSSLNVGATETIGPVTADGNARLWTGIGFGQFTATTGTVILAGDVTATGDGSVSFLGDFALAGTRTITADCFCDVQISTVREHTPAAGLILRGPVNIGDGLSVKGSYRGPTVVERGIVSLDNPSTAVWLRDGTFGGIVGSLLSERGIITGVRATGDLRLSAATTVRVRITENLPVLAAGGVFDIARARLDLTLDGNSRRTLGASYVVGANNGAEPIRGTFSGIREGEVLFQRYRVSYTGGDGNDLTFTDVGRLTTQTSLSSFPSDLRLGDKVTLTAEVRSFETSPQLVSGGQVTFRQGDTVLGTQPVVNGVASIEIQPSWGRREYSATYEGTATMLPSTGTTSVRVDAPTPSITSLDPDTVEGGTTVTITLRGSGFLPGGTVSARATQIPTTFVSSSEVRFTLTVPQFSSADVIHIRYELDEVFSNVLLLKVNAPPPPADSPLVFEARAIRGPVAPGGSAAWLSVGQAIREGRSVIQAAAAVTPDSDRDGIARWEPQYPITGNGLAVMVDMTDRKIFAGRPGSRRMPAPIAFPKAMFLRDANGNYSQVMLSSPLAWNLLWVRPGVGAWYYETEDGSTDDLDATSNGIFVFNTARMFAIDGVSAPTPAGVQPGDVFVGVDWSYAAWFGDIVDEHLRETDGPGSVRFADSRTRSLAENVGNARFTIMRVGGTDGTVSVDYQTVDVSATAGVHYQPVAGRLTFGPGEIVKTIEVPILADSVYSGETMFRIALSNPAGTNVTAPATLDVTLRDDDPRPVLSVQNVTVTEGDEGERVVQWTASISGATRVPVTGTWAYREGDGPEVTGGAFTFMPGGPASQTFTARYTANRIPEPDRIISIYLKDVRNAASAGGRITITDDDFASLTILDATVSETRDRVLVFVSSDTASVKPVTVRYATASGTATEGSDFTATSGTLSFDRTQSLRVIVIPIVPDALNEGPESFSVVLSDVTNATVRKGAATVTIVDDEAGTLPVLTVAPLLVDESLSTEAVFVLRLSYAISSEVRVRVATVAGTAVAGEDFQARDATVTIQPGETEAYFRVTLVNDSKAEPLETFSIALSEPSGATIATPSATATIYDRDSAGIDPNAVTVSVTGGSVAEGNSGTTTLRFTVRLSRASATPLTVVWSTANATATAPTDYVAASGTLTFAPGETAKTVDVVVNSDATYEPDETFTLVAGPTAFATGRIVNDDEPPIRRRPSDS